jgi:hypothetical protein
VSNSRIRDLRANKPPGNGDAALLACTAPEFDTTLAEPVMAYYGDELPTTFVHEIGGCCARLGACCLLRGIAQRIVTPPLEKRAVRDDGDEVFQMGTKRCAEFQ